MYKELRVDIEYSGNCSSVYFRLGHPNDYCFRFASRSLTHPLSLSPFLTYLCSIRPTSSHIATVSSSNYILINIDFFFPSFRCRIYSMSRFNCQFLFYFHLLFILDSFNFSTYWRPIIPFYCVRELYGTASVEHKVQIHFAFSIHIFNTNSSIASRILNKIAIEDDFFMEKKQQQQHFPFLCHPM